MIHAKDIIYTVGDVQSSRIFMFSTMGGYYDTRVGNV